jgi:hypothetical protein
MEQNPQQPTEESIFQEEEFSMEGYDKHIRNARIMLFIVAALTLVNLFTLVPFDDPARIIGAVIVVVFAGVFITLAFWTRRKPYTAILTALIVFCALQLLNFLASPGSLFQGWLLKLAVILLLVLGLGNARESQRMMKAMGKK